MERVRWFTVITLLATAVTILLYATEAITFEDALVGMAALIVLAIVGERE